MVVVSLVCVFVVSNCPGVFGIIVAVLFDPCVLSVAKEFNELLLLSVPVLPGVGVVVNLSAVVPVPVIVLVLIILMFLYLLVLLCVMDVLTYQWFEKNLKSHLMNLVFQAFQVSHVFQMILMFQKIQVCLKNLKFQML